MGSMDFRIFWRYVDTRNGLVRRLIEKTVGQGMMLHTDIRIF